MGVGFQLLLARVGTVRFLELVIIVVVLKVFAPEDWSLHLVSLRVEDFLLDLCLGNSLKKSELVLRDGGIDILHHFYNFLFF